MRILIAEDDRVARHILQTMLGKWGYEVVSCSDGTEAWKVLQAEDSPQLAILDWMMPEMDGVQVCRELRQKKKKAYTYVLLLTARSQKEDVIEGIEAGADDYLTKPFDSQELQARLRAGRRVLDLQAELLKAHEALLFQATHDLLTGLWNREQILDMLRRELSRAKRQQGSVSVMMVDIDHFKQVNDSHGHMVGDRVLQEVSRRMHNVIRPYDGIGRYGGEEFLVVLPGCNLSSSSAVAERLRVAMSREPIKSDGQTLCVTCSLGVASNELKEGAAADWYIRAADAALYRAKSAGRNRIVLASPSETIEESRL